MSLVAYPESDSDGEDGRHAASPPPAQPAADETSSSRAAGKRRRGDCGASTGTGITALPPLPAAFHDLYSTNARIGTSDDPSLHGGRTRAVPHIEGNWPSHVYLEWIPSQTESERLYALIDHVREVIERSNRGRKKQLPVPDITPSLKSSLGTPLPLHISLSRTLQIKTEERDAFLETVTSYLRRAAVRPFEVDFANLKWVPNSERNRWFLVLGIKKPEHDELNRLLDACNEAAVKAGHHGLYTGGHGDGPMEGNAPHNPPRKRRRNINPEGEQNYISPQVVDRSENFHVSIAWNLVDPDPEWISLAQGIDLGKRLQSLRVPFDVVKAKIGNAIHNVQLSTRGSGLSKGGILGLG